MEGSFTLFIIRDSAKPPIGKVLAGTKLLGDLQSGLHLQIRKASGFKTLDHATRAPEMLKRYFRRVEKIDVKLERRMDL